MFQSIGQKVLKTSRVLIIMHFLYLEETLDKFFSLFEEKVILILSMQQLMFHIFGIIVKY